MDRTRRLLLQFRPAWSRVFSPETAGISRSAVEPGTVPRGAHSRFGMSGSGGRGMVTPEERAARLRDAQRLKMARSAHAYVRGSTANFYTWLEAGPTSVPDGPAIWICGDCHLGNLGPLADVNGRIAVQIRDLDQTVIGNPAHDLIRLGLSLASAARGSDLPGVTTARILEQLVSGYDLALAGDFTGGAEEDLRPPEIRRLFRRATRRRWRHLADERLETVEPVVPLGKRFWILTEEERAGLAALFDDPAVGVVVAGLQGEDAGIPISMVDAAYWMKGCSSLGRARYAVMLRVGKGKHAKLCLMDVKEAVTAAAPRAQGAEMPRDAAQRVVAGARALSPHLGQRMIAGRMLGKPFVIRELMPQDLKLEVGRLTQTEAMSLAAYLGGVVGVAHGRLMSAADRRRWRADLTRARSTTLDAPGWLWSSVVDLMGIHERAYLEHCRRHALGLGAEAA